MKLTDEQLRELASNVCDEIAVPRDPEVVNIILQALKQARDTE